MNCQELKTKDNAICNKDSIIVIRDDLGKKAIKLVISNKVREEYCYVKISEICYEGENCDFLIVRCRDSARFLVELKGDGNKNKGASQILSTWTNLKGLYPNVYNNITAILVSDKSIMTNHTNTNYLRLKKRIYESGSNFIDLKSNTQLEL